MSKQEAVGGVPPLSAHTGCAAATTAKTGGAAAVGGRTSPEVGGATAEGRQKVRCVRM